MAMQPFSFDSSKLLEGLNKFQDKADTAIRMYAETSALTLESDAKGNARWEDRTGDARKFLKGTVLRTVNGYRIRLSHGVNYGMWLELANEKKYAVIERTIRYTGTFEIMPGFERLLERMK